MGGVAETSPYWVPLLLGGLGAAGRGLSGGAEGKIGGYGSEAGPPTLGDIQGTLLGDQQNRINTLAGLQTARAFQPISLAGSEVQPVRRLGGGSLPFDLGPTAMDPANIRPGLVSRESAFAPPPMPRFGQGIPELMSALELLGVTQDPTGNFTTGGQKGVSELFTGARPSLGIGETPSGVMSDWSGVEPPGSETPAGPLAPYAGAGDRGGFNPFEGMDDFRGMGPRTTWNMGPATIPGREGWSNPFYRRKRRPTSPVDTSDYPNLAEEEGLRGG
jgi:hypothetical protein